MTSDDNKEIELDAKKQVEALFDSIDPDELDRAWGERDGKRIYPVVKPTKLLLPPGVTLEEALRVIKASRAPKV